MAPIDKILSPFRALGIWFSLHQSPTGDTQMPCCHPVPLAECGASLEGAHIAQLCDRRTAGQKSAACFLHLVPHACVFANPSTVPITTSLSYASTASWTPVFLLPCWTRHDFLVWFSKSLPPNCSFSSIISRHALRSKLGNCHKNLVILLELPVSYLGCKTKHVLLHLDPCT